MLLHLLMLQWYLQVICDMFSLLKYVFATTAATAASNYHDKCHYLPFYLCHFSILTRGMSLYASDASNDALFRSIWPSLFWVCSKISPPRLTFWAYQYAQEHCPNTLRLLFECWNAFEFWVLTFKIFFLTKPYFCHTKGVKLVIK